MTVSQKRTLPEVRCEGHWGEFATSKQMVDWKGKVMANTTSSHTKAPPQLFHTISIRLKQPSG